MALSTQSIHLVKAKAAAFLRNCGGGIGLINKGFWMGLNQDGIQVNLELKPFGNLTGDTVIADVACKVYAIYLKKQANGTDAYFKAVNHATVAAGSTFELSLGLPNSGDEVLLLFPKGIAFSTGITIVSSTTDAGITDSTSGDGPGGFFIIGAA